MMYPMNNRVYCQGRRYTIIYTSTYSFKNSWIVYRYSCMRLPQVGIFNDSLIKQWSGHYDR